MGLDMYLYRISRISSSEQRKLRGKTEMQIHEAGYSVFHRPNSSNDDGHLLDNIKPYLRGIKIPMEYFNMKEIRKDFGIPKNWIRSGERYSIKGNAEYPDITISFCSPDYTESKSALFWSKNYKYITTKLTNCYVCKLEEIGYWRKNYDLQDKLYHEAELDGMEIENCGYYPLTNGMKQAILNDNDDYSDKVHEEDIWTDENSIVVYHEWY